MYKNPSFLFSLTIRTISSGSVIFAATTSSNDRNLLLPSVDICLDGYDLDTGRLLGCLGGIGAKIGLSVKDGPGGISLGADSMSIPLLSADRFLDGGVPRCTIPILLAV